MKKQIISLGLLALLSNFIFAQETVADKKDDFKRWQIRLRTLAIIPNEGDDLPGAQVEIDRLMYRKLISPIFSPNIGRPS